jgi:hypothetical protein
LRDRPSCHVCESPIEGEPAGHGYFFFARGDSFEEERPPLCTRCATAIGVAAMWGGDIEEEEG